MNDAPPPPSGSRLGRGLGSMVNEVAGIKAGQAPTGGGYLRIPLADIREHGPGRLPDAALRDSVKAYGILQPVLVARTEGGYTLLAGSRRLKAAREAGLADVPALIIPPDRAGALDVFLEENLARVELTELERTRCRNQWMRETGRDEDQARKRIPDATPHVTETMLVEETGLVSRRWKFAAVVSAAIAILLAVVTILPEREAEPVLSDQMDIAVETALDEAYAAPDNAWMDAFAFPRMARLIDGDTLTILYPVPMFDAQGGLTGNARLFLFRMAALVLASDRDLAVEITGFGADAVNASDRYRLGLARATAAATLLESEGITPERLDVASSPVLPDTVGAEATVQVVLRPR